jgi:competence protein ComEA
MSDPLDVPRPLGPGPSDFADRVRALRSDARVGAAVLACVALAAGVAWFRAGLAPSASATAPTDAPAGTRSASGPAPPPTALAAAATTTTTVPAAIVVDVVGAVRAPGVVSLSANARVLDAIRAAGGATAGADLSRLNLASKLSDGARIAVPQVGAAPPAVDPSAVSGGLNATVDPSSAGLAPTAGGTAAPIDVNSATVDQLEALPGIGPTLAAAIVQERERNGPFRSVDELTRVPGIGDGRLSQLRDLVTV